jgi:Alkylmercury lyase
MNQPTAPGLDKGCSVGALTSPARKVHLAVMAAFAGTGRAPARGELENIARAHGADPAAALAELAARDVIAFGADGEIRAAYPFSPVPTPIQVRWAGGPLTYAMCAIDALGISAMLGRPVTIIAVEPGTGRIITVHANRDQARWDPGARSCSPAKPATRAASRWIAPVGTSTSSPAPAPPGPGRATTRPSPERS